MIKMELQAWIDDNVPGADNEDTFWAKCRSMSELEAASVTAVNGMAWAKW